MALQRSEQQFRRVVDTAPGAILLIDQTGHIVLVNQRSGALFGYGLDELLGMSVDLLLPEEFRANHAIYREGYFDQPSVRSMGIGRELSGRRKDGSEFPVEIGLSYIHTETGTLALAFVTDITERKRAEEERSQLLIREQEAYAEAQRTKLKERDRISMELHDGVIQSIYAVGMSLEIARTRHVSDADLNNALVHATKDLNGIIDDLRRYIRDLKVEGNSPNEFQQQVQELARKFQASSSAVLQLNIPQRVTAFTGDDLHAVVQLLREALSNIARHANATEVQIDLQESASQAVLRVSDNGLGFASTSVKLGNGLLNMRQRAEQLNGTLDIESQSNQGTTLTFTFPVT